MTYLLMIIPFLDRLLMRVTERQDEEIVDKMEN